jgi:hypothetical protein
MTESRRRGIFQVFRSLLLHKTGGAGVSASKEADATNIQHNLPPSRP